MLVSFDETATKQVLTTTTIHSKENYCQRSQEQEVKFQDQIFSKFQDIFCRFHEAQDTENARVSVLTNLNQSSRSVLQS